MPRLSRLNVPMASSVGARPHGLVVALLVGLSVGAVLWAGVLIWDLRSEPSLPSYLLVLAVYTSTSVLFIVSRVRMDSSRVFDIPVFTTALALLKFGFAPLRVFADPTRLHYKLRGDAEALTWALVYVVLGMLGFWCGSHLICARSACRPSSPLTTTESGYPFMQDSLLARVAIMYCAAVLVRTYGLYTYGYGYGSPLSVYYSHLAPMQVLMVIMRFGMFTLIVLAIERYRHPRDVKCRALFLLVLCSESVWAVMSGAKEECLRNFAVVAIVASLTRRRIEKRWIICALVTLVLMYPFVNSYRYLLRAKGGATKGVSEVSTVASRALDDAVRRAPSGTEWLASGWAATVNRLDMLENVALLVHLRVHRSSLEGGERLWMLPFYPFIPRLIWPEKPLLNKGQRFTVLLGADQQTSTAITYPGDLYLMFGVAGVITGMFALGICGQLLTDRMQGVRSVPGLFLFTAIFFRATNLEVDAFALWSELTRSVILLSLLSWFLYRPARTVGFKVPVFGAYGTYRQSPAQVVVRRLKPFERASP